MEQIVIIHEDGTTLPLFSKKNASTVSKATQKVALQNEDVVAITVQAATPLQLYIGDKIVVFGKRYRLNQPPEVTKDGERKYTYELKFEGAQYELLDIKYHLPEDCYGDNYYSDLYGHLQILMWNINRVRPNEWVLGEYPETTEFKNINTDGKNCLAALQTLCSDYNVEFEITYTGSVTTLNVKKAVGSTLPLTLQFGRGRGLYQLQRKNVNNTGIINRLFVYGGTGNLPQDYPHTKLCLLGTSRLTSYIEDEESIRKYGVKEGEKNYSEVEPEYKGTVTAVGENVLTFADSAMFELTKKKDNGETEWLIDNAAAKVTFQSGGLAGYEFDVHSYDHETRTFVINPFQDENGDVFPSETSEAYQIAEGDEYIITNIRLPNSYVTAAQAKLEEKACEDFLTLVQPQVSYALLLSDAFMIAMFGREAATEVLHVGDSIPIVDEGIGVDKEVRITQYERNLLKPHSYTITLSDTVTRSTTLRVLGELETINEVIAINNLADPAKARRRWLAAQELLGMVFDTEGQYYSDKIKPLSIETTMLSVGAKSQQFVLSNALMEANVGGDPNTFKASNGVLTHYAIKDEIVTWNLTGVSVSKIANKGMYLYAKCSKTKNEGTYHITETALKADADASYYYFLIGTLSSPIADADGKRTARILSLTYGATTINGRFISTGRIQSANGGNTYFDLDNAEIGGKIKFVSEDGTYKDVSDVEKDTNAAKNYIEKSLPSILDAMSTQIDGKIETWYQTSDPADNWDTDAKRQAHVGDLWHNTEMKESKRFSSTFSWEALEDKDAKNALLAASNAQDTADGKRRVFTDTPKVPYDKGDLWVQGATGGILVANVRRTDKEQYTAADWVTASKYTGDENLNAFIDNVYTPAITQIINQLDGVIETWFYSGVPTLNNAPANGWENKEAHLGDIYYNNDDGKSYRFSKEEKNNVVTYKWVEIDDSAVAAAMQAAKDAQNTADGKRRVFVTQPKPPYDEGDLWANGTFLKVCLTGKGDNTTFSEGDWANATNYTGDENLNAFIDGVFKDTVDLLGTKLDGKIECWYTTTDPSTNWSDDEKAQHVGDQWYNTSAKRLYRYICGNQTKKYYYWGEITNQDAITAAETATAAQITANGKRRVFVTTEELPTPYPPYDVGDLWTDGEDLYRCNNARATGSYVASDWGKATNYTDDSALQSFIETTYNTMVEELTGQIDGKIDFFYSASDPSNGWNVSDYLKHVGDQWYNTSTKELKRFVKKSSTLFEWEKIENKDAIDAAEAASQAQAAADGKMRVFVTTEELPTPRPPYDVGDLWLTGGKEDGTLKRCITAKAEGETYLATDWVEATCYDNTKTTIDGGVVTSGTIQLAGNDKSIKAGITGTGTNEKNVRIWAGATFANRANAPFRVLQDGSIHATKAYIEGEIKAEKGEFRGTIYAEDGEFNGTINIGNGAIVLNKDGSGTLGNGEISWQANYGGVTIPFLKAGEIWGYNQLTQNVNYNVPFWDNTAMGFNYIPDADTTKLPATPDIARPYVFVNTTTHKKKLNGNGYKIWSKGSEYDTVTLQSYEIIILMFSGKWYVVSRLY